VPVWRDAEAGNRAPVFDVIPAPGTAWGPCAEQCDHEQCVQHRLAADRPCIECSRPLGYDEGYTVESLDWSRVLHRRCALARFERPRAMA
jgi:hypothetical protein